MLLNTNNSPNASYQLTKNVNKNYFDFTLKIILATIILFSVTLVFHSTPAFAETTYSYVFNVCSFDQPIKSPVIRIASDVQQKSIKLGKLAANTCQITGTQIKAADPATVKATLLNFGGKAGTVKVIELIPNTQSTTSVQTTTKTTAPTLGINAISGLQIIHMSDTSVGSGRSTHSGRSLHTEFVSPTSQLVGDVIDSITMKLKKTNSPTGIAQIGVFNDDLSVKKLFGTIDSATMSPSYADLTFSLPLGQTYQIQSGDRIGIKFTGGDSTNRISTMIDDNAADPFDGTNSYHTYYTTFWNQFPTNDLYMILSQSNTGTTDTTAPVTTATPPGGSYSTPQSVTLTANEAATIYYSTDGSPPTLVYSSPIPISTTTLKFFAKDTAGNSESVNTLLYTINPTTTIPSITINDVSLAEGDSGAKNFVFTVARSTNTGAISVNYSTADNTAVIPIDYTAKPTTPLTFAAGGPLTQTVTVPVMGDIAVEPNETFSVNLSNCVGCAISDNQGVGTIINDDLPPVTTATPPGGFYSTSQSVTLTANEPATIYYTTNNSTPTTSSTVYSSPIPISATTTLKFFAKDTAGNLETVKTQTYTINTSSTSDVFGIKQIYPTKTSGNTWFMNMDKATSDSRFDSQTTITKNVDGSWKMKGNSAVRMNVFSTDKKTYENTKIPTLSRTQLSNNGYMQLPSDWKNFEMTGYVKLNAGSNDDFTWYGRGGSHNDVNGGCEGSAYKAELSFNGGTRFAKETWHVSYDFTKKKSSTTAILDKWIGFKFILFNKPGVNFAQQAQGEIWVDLQNNNNWVKVDSFVDDGWGSGASHCGPATAENMPITWGGPKATFRADNSSDFDFKYLSIREIQ
jgi:hypothetical protein